MPYSAIIIELKYLYIYISIAAATTLSYVLVYFFNSDDSFKKKFLSYISYSVTIFVIVVALFLLFTRSVYWSALFCKDLRLIGKSRTN